MIFQELLDGISDPFLVLDSQLLVTYCNLAAERWLQRPRRAMMGMRFSDVLPESKGGAFEMHCSMAWRENRAMSWEICFGVGPGLTWYEARIYPQAGGLTVLWQVITERKQAEERLRQSETFINTILDQSPHSMWVSDERGTLLRTNQALRDLFQVTDEELVGQYNLFKDEVVQEQGFTPLVRDVFEKGRTARFQITYDSSKIKHLKLARTTSATLEVTISPIFGEDRRVHHAIVQHVDITELKRAEAVLRASEERYRRLFESVNDAVFLRPIAPEGIGGNFIEVNEVACRRLGYTRQELLQKSPADIDPCTDLEEVKRRVRQLQSGEGIVFETVHLAKDGRRIPVEISSHLFVWESQEMILSVARDLTERKLSEAALRESERRFREMMENVQLVSVMLDVESRILFINQFLLELTGWKEEEVLGKPWFEIFIPSEQAAEVRKAFQLVIGGVPLPHYENEIVTRSGERRLIRWNNTELKDASGQIIGLTSIGEDITERRRLEEQLRQAQKMEAIGVLAGGVAHDFNNILAAMMLHLNLCQSDPQVTEEMAGSLKELSAGAERAANLTRQLLLFSRKQMLDAKPLDFRDILRNLMLMLRRIIGEDIELIFCAPESSIWIQADAGMMEQIVMNLCVNARDAMPHGGRLTLALHRVELTAESVKSHPEGRPGPFVCLSVSDTGCGMEESTLKRIFEPFFTTKEVGRGTGLGLATVYGIVKQHQGWVEVESAVGQGSSFRVYFPESSQTARVSSLPRESMALPGGTETILLVEDEPAVRRAIALRLRKLGYAVLEAAHGIEAWQTWEERKQPIDLLLTDMVMPKGMTGMELARQLRRAQPGIKIIISSGYHTEILRPDHLGMSGITYLAKPYDGMKLARTVRQCLDGRT